MWGKGREAVSSSNNNNLSGFKELINSGCFSSDDGHRNKVCVNVCRK